MFAMSAVSRVLASSGTVLPMWAITGGNARAAQKDRVGFKQGGSGQACSIVRHRVIDEGRQHRFKRTPVTPTCIPTACCGHSRRAVFSLGSNGLRSMRARIYEFRGLAE